jgi:hypothetical protein
MQFSLVQPNAGSADITGDVNTKLTTSQAALAGGFSISLQYKHYKGQIETAIVASLLWSAKGGLTDHT